MSRVLTSSHRIRAPFPRALHSKTCLESSIAPSEHQMHVHLLPAVSPTSGGEHLAQAPKQKHLHARTAQLPGYTSNLRALGPTSRRMRPWCDCRLQLASRLRTRILLTSARMSPTTCLPSLQKITCSSPWVSHLRGLDSAASRPSFARASARSFPRLFLSGSPVCDRICRRVVRPVLAWIKRARPCTTGLTPIRRRLPLGRAAALLTAQMAAAESV